MRAIRQYEFGAPGVLRYETVPDPAPAAGQVSIAVEAAGVHLIDTVIRRGVEGGPFPLPQLPMTPGREVAGVVAATGPDVDPAWLGRRVVAHLGQASGGYAELAVAPVAALHETALDALAAVAMIGTGRTAMGVLEEAALTRSDVVVVTAAAGGLGSLFVQAAARLGAVVVGLAGGAAKAEQVRALGATIAVDYQQDDWADQVRAALDGRVVSVVLDGVGGSAGTTAAGLLGAGGRLVLFGNASGSSNEAREGDLGITRTWVVGQRMMQRPGGLRDLETKALAAASSGEWVAQVQTFPLAEGATAHAALESRDTTGKVVLVP